jgi:hypothetical protein
MIGIGLKDDGYEDDDDAPQVRITSPIDTAPPSGRQRVCVLHDRRAVEPFGGSSVQTGEGCLAALCAALASRSVEAVCVAVNTESLGTQHLPSGHFDAAVVAFSPIQPRSWTQVNESIDACLPLPRLSIAVCALHVPLLASPAVHLAHQKADTPVITSAAVRRFVQAKSASLERAGLGRSLQAFALSQIPTITLDGTATSAEIQRLDATTLDDLSAWIDTVVEKRADVRGGSSQFEMTWSQQIALGQSHFEERAQLVEWFTVEHDEHSDDQIDSARRPLYVNRRTGEMQWTMPDSWVHSALQRSDVDMYRTVFAATEAMERKYLLRKGISAQETQRQADRTSAGAAKATAFVPMSERPGTRSVRAGRVQQLKNECHALREIIQRLSEQAAARSSAKAALEAELEQLKQDDAHITSESVECDIARAHARGRELEAAVEEQRRKQGECDMWNANRQALTSEYVAQWKANQAERQRIKAIRAEAQELQQVRAARHRDRVDVLDRKLARLRERIDDAHTQRQMQLHSELPRLRREILEASRLLDWASLMHRHRPEFVRRQKNSGHAPPIGYRVLELEMAPSLTRVAKALDRLNGLVANDFADAFEVNLQTRSDAITHRITTHAASMRSLAVLNTMTPAEPSDAVLLRIVWTDAAAAELMAGEDCQRLSLETEASSSWARLYFTFLRRVLVYSQKSSDAAATKLSLFAT